MTEPTAPNASTAFARVFADELVRHGITDVVVAPGSRSTALALAVHARPELRVHVEIDERSAAFLAIGLARGGGSVGVVVTTSGSATANLHPAVVEADTGGVPLLVVTADRPPELHHVGANQTIEQVGMFGSAVRAMVDLAPPEDVPGANGSWRAAIGGALTAASGDGVDVAGPVHLNVAFREPTVPRTDDGRSVGAVFTGDLSPLDAGAAPRPALRGPRPDKIARVAELLDVDWGVVVAGDGAGRGAAALAEHLGWPLIAEPHSGARHGPCLIAHAGPLLTSAEIRSDLRVDAVLRIGRTGLSPAVSKHTGGAAVVTVTGDRWHDHADVPGEVVVGDVAPSLRALRSALDARPSGAWLDQWRRRDASAERAIAAVVDDGPLTEPGVARATVAALGGGGRLFLASSRPIRDLDAWAGSVEVDVHANRGASGIDGIVSTVLGVALASGPTVALVGDLSLLHDANGFLVRPDGEPPTAVFVVVDNNGGGLFHALPQAAEEGFERLFGTPHDRDLADLARFHRLAYVEISSLAQLGEAIPAAVATGGVHVLHVRTDRYAAQQVQQDLLEAVVAAS